MANSNSIIAGVGLADAPRKSRWPARLDLIQSGTGLLLALFMWGHMFFVSSILISNDAMWTITKFFEGYFFFGRSYPVIVSFVVAGGDRDARRARVSRRAQVPDQLSPVHVVPRPHEDDAPRGHHALVLAGGDRVRAVLLRRAASVRHADAPGADRSVRVGRPRVDRALLAALHPAAARGRVPRRHRSVSPRGEMGLVRRTGPERDAASG